VNQGKDRHKRTLPRQQHPHHHATLRPGWGPMATPTRAIAQAEWIMIRKGGNSEREAQAEVWAQPDTISWLDLLCAPALPAALYLQTGAEKVPAVPLSSPPDPCRRWEKSRDLGEGSTPPSQAPLPKTLRGMAAPSQGLQQSQPGGARGLGCQGHTCHQSCWCCLVSSQRHKC